MTGIQAGHDSETAELAPEYGETGSEPRFGQGKGHGTGGQERSERHLDARQRKVHVGLVIDRLGNAVLGFGP